MDPLGRLFPLVAAFVDHQDAKTVISFQLAVSRVFVTISCWIYCWMVDKPPEKPSFYDRSKTLISIHWCMDPTASVTLHRMYLYVRFILGLGVICVIWKSPPCLFGRTQLQNWRQELLLLQHLPSQSASPPSSPPPLLSSSSISDGPFDSCGVVGSATSPTWTHLTALWQRCIRMHIFNCD